MTYKNIDNALNHCKSNYITLDDVISKIFYHNKRNWSALKFSGEDTNKSLHLNDLVDLIGGRGDYSILLRRLIANGKSCGLFDRIVYNGKKWIYIAGQDYTAEMNTIRKILREGL